MMIAAQRPRAWWMWSTSSPSWLVWCDSTEAEAELRSDALDRGDVVVERGRAVDCGSRSPSRFRLGPCRSSTLSGGSVVTSWNGTGWSGTRRPTSGRGRGVADDDLREATGDRSRRSGRGADRSCPSPDVTWRWSTAVNEMSSSRPALVEREGQHGAGGLGRVPATPVGRPDPPADLHTVAKPRDVESGEAEALAVEIDAPQSEPVDVERCVPPIDGGVRLLARHRLPDRRHHRRVAVQLV
jgi:hypothetical protein